MRKSSILFFVLFFLGCAASTKEADAPENAVRPQVKTPAPKTETTENIFLGKMIHNKCGSCHINQKKGLLYPFIKTKSERVNPHSKKVFSRTEAICTSCHDFFHYVHPDGVPDKSERIVFPENVRLDKGKLNCLSCHDVHQEKPSYKNLYPAVSGGDKLKSFCLTCHVNVDQLKDDVYYMLTELRILALKEHDVFLDKADEGWFYTGPSFIKRFYESVKGVKRNEMVQVEESFQIRKNTSIALDAIATGDLDQAIHMLWTVFRKDSDFAQGYTSLAKGFVSMGGVDVAEKFYSHALSLDRTYAPAYFGLGMIYSKQDRYWEAIERYGKAVRNDPGMKEAYFEMGNSYIQVKNYSEAISAYKEVVNLDPKNLTGYLKLGRIYQITGDYIKATRILTEALIFYPEHFEIHYELGNAYYASSAMDRAINSYERALKVKPGDFDANIRLGKTYEMVQDTQKAVRHYENAVTTDRYSVEGYLNLARLYRSLNDPSKAEKAARSALQIRPDSVDVRMALGDGYYQDKDYAQAEQEYKQVLLRHPGHREAKLRLGVLYFRSGRKDKAIGVFGEMVENKSTQAEVYLLLGECLGPQEAAKIYRQGIRHSTHKAVLHFNLAYLYWKELDEPRRARKTYEAVIADYPAYAMAYFYMGCLLKEQEDISRAAGYLEKVVEIDPGRIDAYILLAELDSDKYSQTAHDKVLGRDLADFKDSSDLPYAQYEKIDNKERERLYYKLGTLYLADGKWENAAESFKRVLMRNPAHPEALSNIVIAYRARKRLDKVLKILTQLSKLHPEVPGIYVEIGNIYKYMGKKKQAFRNYLIARDLDPDDLSGKSAKILNKLKGNKKELLAQGDAHYKDQEYFQAERKYKAVVSLEPDNPDANLRLWRLYNNSGRKAKAVDILMKMVEGKSARAEFYLLLGEHSKPEDAIGIYRQGLKFSKNKAVLYFNLGYLYREKNKELDLAAEACKMAIVSYPAYAKAYLYLGRVLKAKENIPQAVRYLEKAIELDPNRIDAYLLLAELGEGEYYARLFQNKKLADFNEISDVPYAEYELDLKGKKQKEEFYYKLGTIYLGNGNWENAAEAFARVLKWNPGRLGVMKKLGIAYKAQGKFQQALKTLGMLLKDHPEDPKIFFEIGNVYKDMEQGELAQENYLKARVLTTDGTKMMSQLELALADVSYDIWYNNKAMDLLVKAKNYHEKALETYPEYKKFRLHLEEIKKLINGRIQVFMLKTRSRKKYKEIRKQILQRSTLTDLRRVAGKYPKHTEISYVHPRDLDKRLAITLDGLKDGEISPVIKIKNKYIGIYRILSADGGTR